MEYVLRQYELFSGLLIERVPDLELADFVIQHGGEEKVHVGKYVLYIPEGDVSNSEADLQFTSAPSISRFKTDIIEYVYVQLSYKAESGRHSFGNFYDESFFRGSEHWYNLPLVNIAFKELTKAILSDDRRAFFRNSHPESSKASLALTHDVDYYELDIKTRIKLLRNAAKALRRRSPDARLVSLLRYCMSGSKIDLDLARQIEANMGCSSSFNYSGYIASERDSWKQRLINPSYDFAGIRSTDRMAQAELAVHPSTCTTSDEERFRGECQRVCSAGWKGGRQHMLALRFPETFEIMQRVGYRYDTSIGFNDYNGYRGSNAVPHYPVRYEDAREYGFIEYPLIFMDSVFTKQGIVDPDIIAASATALAGDAVRWSMTGSICWHDVAFRNGSSMMEAYRRILETFRSANIFLGTPKQLVDFHAPFAAAIVKFNTNQGTIRFAAGAVSDPSAYQIKLVSSDGCFDVKQRWDDNELSFAAEDTMT